MISFLGRCSKGVAFSGRFSVVWCTVWVSFCMWPPCLFGLWMLGVSLMWAVYPLSSSRRVGWYKRDGDLTDPYSTHHHHHPRPHAPTLPPWGPPSPALSYHPTKGDASKSDSEVDIYARSMEDVWGLKKDGSASAGGSCTLELKSSVRVKMGGITAGGPLQNLPRTSPWQILPRKLLPVMPLHDEIPAKTATHPLMFSVWYQTTVFFSLLFYRGINI